MSAPPILLDFAAPRIRITPAAVVLLVFGLCAVLAVCLAYRQAALQRDGLELKLAAALRRSTNRPVAEAQVARMSEEATVVARELGTPWTSMLTELEAASQDTKGQVAVLSVEPDHEKHRVRINGESRDLALALGYVTRLQNSKLLRYPMLDSHEVVVADNEHPIRFSLTADSARVTMTTATSHAGKVTPITSAAVIERESGRPAAVRQAVALAAFPSGKPPSQPLKSVRAPNRNLVARVGQIAARTLPLAVYRVGQIGPAGVAGGLATMVALAVGAVAILSIHNATDLLSRQIAGLQHPVVASTVNAGLGKVLATLPTREQMPALIGQVLQQAELAGVTLDTGHYSYSPPKTGHIGRYDLEFPLRAEYPNVRDFINRTLNSVPSAGLDKLRIERKVVGEALVSADVQFVVFVRSESPP